MSQPSKTTCRRVDERDGCRCVKCGKSLYNVLTFSRHHRRMRSHAFSGLHKASNLIDVCGSGDTGCHGYIHAHPAESYANGWLIHSYEEHPETVPINTFHGWVLLDNEGHWTPTQAQMQGEEQ